VALIALLIEPYKDEKYVKFHAIQAIALWVVGIAVNVIWAIPVVGWIVGAVVSVALVVFAIIGLIKAFSGEYWEMPVVYGIVKGWIGE